MGDNASFISYSPVEAIGTRYEPISISRASNNKPWGVFAIVNTEQKTSTISYTQFSGGGEDTINGIYYSGMLAIHNGNGEVSYSEFRKNYGDDALNIQGGNIHVYSNLFEETFSDGIDVDFTSKEAGVEGNTFKNIGGDAIDLSWSDIIVSKNIIEGCGDKGVSVGERSNPKITENSITNCNIGVAIKDQSQAIISNNKFTQNKTALSLYQKKEIFGGGEVTLENNIFLNNNVISTVDSTSTIHSDLIPVLE